MKSEYDKQNTNPQWVNEVLYENFSKCSVSTIYLKIIYYICKLGYYKDGCNRGDRTTLQEEWVLSISAAQDKPSQGMAWILYYFHFKTFVLGVFVLLHLMTFLMEKLIAKFCGDHVHWMLLDRFLHMDCVFFKQ